VKKQEKQEKQEKVQVKVFLPKDLHRKLKIKATMEETTITEIFHKAAEDYINEKDQ